MIRIDLFNVGNVKYIHVYGKFVLTVYATSSTGAFIGAGVNLGILSRKCLNVSLNLRPHL